MVLPLKRRENWTSLRLQHQLRRLDLLIQDELGYAPFSKSGAELLSDVVGRTDERTGMIATANLHLESWVEVMGSERLTGTTLGRFTRRVHILEANGANYRLLNAKSWFKQKSRYSRAWAGS